MNTGTLFLQFDTCDLSLSVEQSKNLNKYRNKTINIMSINLEV